MRQSKIAIGSGGVVGRGFLKGTQTRFDFVPEQRTDFIFCTIGEGFGFVGSTIVLGIYLFLLLRIVTIAERQQKRIQPVLCIWRCFCFLLPYSHQCLLVTIGLAPVIGIPLPLISYGGTSYFRSPLCCSS